jgi:S-adenosylmethionine hydrolase
MSVSEHKTQQIITLTTDWNNTGFYLAGMYDEALPPVYPLGDHYVAQLKGILMRVAPEAVIVDISHRIQAFNAIHTAYVLRQAYRIYPPGTIHLVGVNSEPSPRNKLVFIQKDEHFFVGANDGMFSMVFEGNPDFIAELQHDSELRGFAAIQLFALSVKYVVDKYDLSDIGIPCEMKRDIVSNAAYDENEIRGTVIFIDSFGNLITNVSRELFEKVGKNRPFRICIRSERDSIDRISQYYDDVPERYRLAMFNSDGMLEIAMRNCNMAQLERLDTHTVIHISFDGTRLFY